MALVRGVVVFHPLLCEVVLLGPFCRERQNANKEFEAVHWGGPRGQILVRGK